MGILRLFLALSVAIQHSGGSWGLGAMRAVQIFFIISGFYMCLILSEGKYKDYKTFIINRFLRIFPLYWVIAFCAILFTPILIYLGYPPTQTSLEAYILHLKSLNLIPVIYFIFTNIFIYFQEVALFLGLKDGSLYFTGNFGSSPLIVFTFLLIPQAWSLAIELTFYLIAPLLLWAKKSLNILLILTALSLICNCSFLIAGYPYDPWGYRFFPSLLHLFLYGALTYKFYSSKAWLKIKPLKYYKIFILAGLGIYLLFYSNYISIESFKLLKFFKFFLTDIFSNFGVALSICAVFHLTRRIHWDRWIGELSYPIYISHYLILTILPNFLKRDNHIFPCTVAALSILSSIILIRWIQTPIDNYRAMRIKQSVSKTEENFAPELKILTN